MRRHKHQPRTARAVFESRISNGKPNVLIEGDSWFGFLPWDNISDYVRDTNDYNVFDISNSGEEMLDMLSGRSRKRLILYLKSAPFDYVLWSGGGNDVFGNLYYYLSDEKRLATKMAQLEHAYHDLCDLVKEYCPAAKIITHEYDRVYASGMSVDIGPLRVAGPWLKPSLDALKIPEADHQYVLDKMISNFGEMLERVEALNKNFVVAKTQGTLDKHHWNDELHPNSEGFKWITKKITQLMK